MRKLLKYQLVLSIVIVMSLLGGVTSYVHAADTPTVGRMGVILVLNPLQPMQMGTPITLEGTIHNRLWVPLADKAIVFYLDNEVIGQTSSDINGHFSRTFYRDLDAGEYKITAVSKETHTLLGTATVITLKVLPVTLSVQTTPAIAGVAFMIDGTKFYSGAGGLAQISLDKAGEHTLLVLADEYKNPTQRIEFGRWLDEVYVPSRVLFIPKDTNVQVGLNVFQLVKQNFVDLDGFPVDPSRITQFTFRSMQGDSFTFPDGSPRWIPASRVARWTSVLNETKIYYSVTGVMIDGANVVNQSQQRFYASSGGTWDISLILYSLQVNARDGLFGFPVGKSITLEYPDGHTANFALDNNGSVSIHSLARGTYTITVNGASGMKNRFPVALSKNQVVNSKILTSFDISLAAGMVGVLALALLFIGRPWLMGTIVKAPQKLWSFNGSIATRMARLKSGASASEREREALTAWLQEGRTKQQTGLSREGFDRLLDYLETNLPKPGHAAKLSLADQLTMTLKQVKKNASDAELAAAYHVSKSTVRRTVQRIQGVLNKCEDFKTSSQGTPAVAEAGTKADNRQIEAPGMQSNLGSVYK